MMFNKLIERCIFYTLFLQIITLPKNADSYSCAKGNVKKRCNFILNSFYILGGPESSFGIATRYGLDSPGIESLWGRVFPHPSRPALGPT